MPNQNNRINDTDILNIVDQINQKRVGKKLPKLNEFNDIIIKCCTPSSEIFTTKSDKAKKVLQEELKKINSKQYKQEKGQYFFQIPKTQFKKNDIMETECFATDYPLKEDINFFQDEIGKYPNDIENFCSENNLANKSGMFYSKNTYRPNLKVLECIKDDILINDISIEIYELNAIQRINHKITSKKNLHFTKFPQFRGLAKRIIKNKTITLPLSLFCSPLESGVFDLIFNKKDNTYHEIKDCVIIADITNKKNKSIFLIPINIGEKLGEEYEYNEEETPQHRVLNRIYEPQTIYGKQMEFNKLLDVLGKSFPNIISAKNPAIKYCDTLERIELKKVSLDYTNTYMQPFSMNSTSVQIKDGFVIYPYSKLPKAVFKEGIIPNNTEDINNFQIGENYNDISINLNPVVNDFTYKNLDLKIFEENRIAIRGSDKNGKAIFYDSENYTKTQPICYNVEEKFISKTSIRPYKIFLIETKDALNIGVFDNIQTMHNVKYKIIKARIFLNKNINKAIRDHKDMSSVFRALKITGPSANINISHSLLENTTGRIDLLNLGYDLGAPITSLTSPLDDKNGNSCSLLILEKYEIVDEITEAAIRLNLVESEA